MEDFPYNGRDGLVRITRQVWLRNNRRTLELMNGNLVPAAKTSFERYQARNRCFLRTVSSTHGRLRPRTSAAAVVPAPEHRDFPSGVPELDQHHTVARTRVILADSKPLFVVSTHNRLRPNTRCSLGQTIERAASVERTSAAGFYRANRGDRTEASPEGRQHDSISPMGKTQLFVTRWTPGETRKSPVRSRSQSRGSAKTAGGSGYKGLRATGNVRSLLRYYLNQCKR